jgi:molecular chaperone GrpE (heat shock protein)
MASYKLRRLLPRVSLLLLSFVWIAAAGEAQGQTLYEYIDKDGTVIITDSPPPGVNVKKSQSLPNMTEEQKTASEKEGNKKLQRYREADAKRKEREENIRVVREELEKAKRDEENYRANMNKASGYAQRHHWRTLVDEQLKLIDEKKKKLDDLESRP